MTIMKQNPTCLFPECSNPVVTRGLCQTHYVSASNLVRAKHTTWDKLIELGRALGPRRNLGATDWFLKGIKP